MYTEEVKEVCERTATWKFGIGRYINHKNSKKGEAAIVPVE